MKKIKVIKILSYVSIGNKAYIVNVTIKLRKYMRVLTL